MKFVDLKKNLANKLDPVYIIEGDDRLVVKMAQEMIEKRVGLQLPEINRIVLDGEKLTVDEIIEATLGYPMVDEKKLIVIKDFNSKQKIDKLENLLSQNIDYLVILFVNNSPNETTKKILKFSTFVDCNKLDEKVIKQWVLAKLFPQDVQIEQLALDSLIKYCSSNLMRIDSELSKLVGCGEKLITQNLVDMYVVPDKDYQIYELQNYIANGDSVHAVDLVNSMLLVEKNSVGLIQYLYQAFRKLLIISLSTATDEELALALKCKPYAIKMSRVMISKFSPKRLKKINEQLSNLEYDIKLGKACVEGSVVGAVCRILLEK